MRAFGFRLLQSQYVFTGKNLEKNERENENRKINKIKQKRCKNTQKSYKMCQKVTPLYVRQWVYDLKLIHERPLKGPSI